MSVVSGVGRGRAAGGGRRSRRRVSIAILASALVLLVLPGSASAITDGHIKGTVTAKSGGAPIEGDEVCAEATVGSAYNCEFTNSEGKYELEIPEGSYKVAFYNENCTEECTWVDYLNQYYNGRASEDEAEPVAVKSGEVKSGINAALVTAAKIEGQVTALVGGSELAGVYVCAYTDETEYVDHCTYTEEEGYYSLPGLPTGKYSISFEADQQDFVKQYYKEKLGYEEATLVQATDGSETPGISAQLRKGETVEGVVTAAAGGGPVSDIDVCPYRVSGAEAECQFTGPHGEYKLQGLEGEYEVDFYGNGSTLASEIYENAQSRSSAKRIVAKTAGAVVKGIDAALPAAGQITGFVTAAPAGTPVAGVEVCTESEAEFRECAKSSSTGEYTIKGVGGTVVVEAYGYRSCVSECVSLPYVFEYYNGAYNYENAERLLVAPGAKLTGINIRLAGSIKQGEEETRARVAAETAKRKHEEEVAEQELIKKREAEAKAAGEVIGEAAGRKALEAQLQREAAARASVKLVSVRVTGTALLMTFRAGSTDTVTVSGSAVHKAVVRIPAGTHVVTVKLTPSGRSARTHRRTVALAISVKVGTYVVSLSRLLKL